MLKDLFVRFRGVLALLFITALTAPAAQAQVTVGGHVGFVIPWVTRSAGNTTNIGDNFQIGFPLGVTFHGPARMNIDLEMVPSFSDSPRNVTLTVDPGVVWTLNRGWAAGIRAAFDVNSPTVGFIPLVNKSWKFKDQKGFFKAYFVEADFPTKFSRPTGQPASNSFTFATHFGLGF